MLPQSADRSEEAEAFAADGPFSPRIPSRSGQEHLKVVLRGFASE